MTKNKRKGSIHSQNFLQIIHTNVLLSSSYFNGLKCLFTSLIFSCDAYIFLICNKSSALDVFKIQKTKVQNRPEKITKIERSAREGDCCKKYNENNPFMRGFANYLQKCDVGDLYTMPGTLEHNDVD